MKIAVTDIETNGLYDDVTTWHCAWIIDPVTGEYRGYRPYQFKEYLHDLMEYDVVVGHNIIDYDLPTLKKLHPDFVSPPVFDTIVLSRMLQPDRLSHSLKSWGVELGLLKGDYGEQEDAWEVYSEDMYEYCKRDVEVTVKLLMHLCKLAGFDWQNLPSTKLEF